MPAYRFCRTDDLPLLAAAFTACWGSHFAAARALEVSDFKRDARELNLWTSSCMLATSGAETIAVLLGAKRDDAYLIHRLAVKPGHERQGHGRHLLDSMRRKVQILGPPRLLVEVPAAAAGVCRFFERCGFAAASRYVDFVMDAAPAATAAASGLVCEASLEELLDGAIDLAGNPPRAWERSLQTLKNRDGQITGLAIASDARVEAYLLTRARPRGVDIVALGGTQPALLRLLVDALYERSGGPLRIPKLNEAEIPFALLTALGFRAAADYVGYQADFSDL